MAIFHFNARIPNTTANNIHIAIVHHLLPALAAGLPRRRPFTFPLSPPPVFHEHGNQDDVRHDYEDILNDAYPVHPASPFLHFYIDNGPRKGYPFVEGLPPLPLLNQLDNQFDYRLDELDDDGRKKYLLGG